ncbi:MAG: 2-(1,2-epoxy,2-dihydrophenyl)acetyl-CoA isomerase [Hydrocarboniphaga sp.]|uniref:enoyl-CoA hydratase-related protein n=1 Tax=Hydrocarboniphaga sp. TaxID=2033016 RepID=UPI002630CBD6|nr:enoyl-CoA hydratase-related protein [Hydrocarboniphaga sp.]MDB5972307.1 2-(1,2-epoxy,2-dihydrophenyl)acetyl-CoA isomerase [Hydrocarboniphaga sp.]
MSYSKLLVENVDGVGIIRLNEPATLNAVTIEMVEELDRALDQLSRSTRALILTGSGRAFCAGANISGGVSIESDDGLPDAGAVLESHINPLMSKLRNLPIPWISAVRGAAAGVGCSFALAADLIVAGEGAYFLQAFCRIGLVPDGGSSFLLTRAIGRPRAMEMMMLGERMPAAKALEWGLVNRVVADDEVETAAMHIARSLANGPTRSLGLIREAAWTAAESGWEQTLASERRLQRAAGRTGDHQEGINAFLEKRPARFTGA